MIHMTLPYPPTSNRRHSYNGNRPRRTDRANQFRDAVLQKLVDERWNKDPLHGDIFIVLDYYRPRKSGDLANYQKELFDCLQSNAWGVGLYKDDAQIVSFFPMRYEDKSNPRVEIWVTNDWDEYCELVDKSKALYSMEQSKKR